MRQYNRGSNSRNDGQGPHERVRRSATVVTTPERVSIRPTEETVAEGYCGNLGFPCTTNMLRTADINHDAVTHESRMVSLLVDTGASGHYLDSNLIPGLDNNLEEYTVIEDPIKIIGAGRH